MDKSQPGLFVIERCSALRDAFRKDYPYTKLFYHSICLSKKLRFQLKAIAMRANFSIDTQKLVTRIARLPLIDGETLFEVEIAECLQLFNDCPEANTNPLYRDCKTIMRKLQDE